MSRSNLSRVPVGIDSKMNDRSVLDSPNLGPTSSVLAIFSGEAPNKHR